MQFKQERFTITDLTYMAHLTPSKMNYLLKKGEVPRPTRGIGTRKHYSRKDVAEILKSLKVYQD